MVENKLLQAIKSRGITSAFLARRLGICYSAFYLKVNGKRPWRRLEIEKLIELLHLNAEEIAEIFPQAA